MTLFIGGPADGQEIGGIRPETPAWVIQRQPAFPPDPESPEPLRPETVTYTRRTLVSVEGLLPVRVARRYSVFVAGRIDVQRATEMARATMQPATAEVAIDPDGRPLEANWYVPGTAP